MMKDQRRRGWILPQSQFGDEPAGSPGMTSYAPPPMEQKGFPWGPVLIGCGVVVLLIIVASGVACYVLFKSGGELVSKGMEVMVEQTRNQLTPEHSAEDRERFSQLARAVYIDEYKRLGMISWSVTYQTVIQRMTNISADGEITVEESQGWCDEAYAALEKNGYWAEEETTE